MNAVLASLDRLSARVSRNADLAILWLLTLIFQPIVAPELPFAAEDMLPWALGTVAVASMVRGRRLGAGPHPQLRPRRVLLDGRLRRMAAALTPLVLLPWYRFGQSLGRGELADIVAGLQARELSALAGLGWVGSGVAGVAVVGALVLLSRDFHRTAWRPLTTPTARTIGSGAAAFWLGAVLAGTLHGLALGDPELPQRSILRWVPEAMVVGLAFLGSGLVFGRPSNLAQRQAAGRRDGQAVPFMEREFLFALLGPSTTLFLTLQLVELLTGQLVGYESAFVVSLHAVAWAGVVWKRRVPRAVDVLLHEVAPAGGKELAPGEVAEGFDRPPEGALRIDPLNTRPTRSIHAWRVPVTRSRITDLDDPIRSLWRQSRHSPAHHLLGEAGFEPDVSGAPQWAEITVHLGAGRDVTVIQDQDVQTRRMVVLRPFPRGITDQGAPLRTYRWEQNLPPGSVQVVDAATRRLHLRDGDLIVVSSEGVARAYRVEIGAPVGDDDAPVQMRLPQLQDYSAQ